MDLLNICLFSEIQKSCSIYCDVQQNFRLLRFGGIRSEKRSGAQKEVNKQQPKAAKRLATKQDILFKIKIDPTLPKLLFYLFPFEYCLRFGLLCFVRLPQEILVGTVVRQ